MHIRAFIPLRLRTDITGTLARLRMARAVDATEEIRLATRRLDYLLDQVSREKAAM